MVINRTVQLTQAYQTAGLKNSNRYQYRIPPPSTQELLASYDSLDVPQKVYQVPYYSFPPDVPDRPKEYGGLAFTLKGKTVSSLEEWHPTSMTEKPLDDFKKLSFSTDGIAGWEYAGHPPSVRETRNWLAGEGKNLTKGQTGSGKSRRFRSQVCLGVELYHLCLRI